MTSTTHDLNFRQDDTHASEGALVTSHNQMEILLFNLGTDETFGINVFKVKEVCKSFKITRSPNMPKGVDGIVSLRGHVMPVLNLAKFMDIPLKTDNLTMLIAEYSRHTLGFLVAGVDRIIRVDWHNVRATDGMIGNKGQLVSAITETEDGALVSILDVEQVLANAFGEDMVGAVERVDSDRHLCVFFVDDSTVARRKISEVLDKMGVKNIQAINGRDAWERLRTLADASRDQGTELSDQLQIILTDAEMPEMDGYVLTQKIKSDRRFDQIPVVMHSSLTSNANRIMGTRAGVDYFVPKFDSQMLSETLRPLLVAH